MSINAGQREVVSKTQSENWTDNGFCFQYNAVVTFPSATNKYFLFDPTAVPDGYVLHVSPLLFSNCEDGPVYVNYYVGHNYTGGTPVALLNRNSNSSNTASSVIYENPTGTVLGTKTSANKIATGGGVPAFPGGGSSLASSPYIQSNQVTVLIEIDNNSGAPVDAEGYFQFCEVPKGYN